MFLQKLHHIRAFVLDVDGVLTNGNVLVTESGEQLRQFNIKDGYALQHAVKKGYEIVILSGGRSKGVEIRLKGLGIKRISLGLDTKMEAYQEFINSTGFQSHEVLYMGDDLPDLPVMKLAGIAACPADAASEIKAVSHYISPLKGGTGCVRDIIEQVLRVRNDWHEENPSAHDAEDL